MYFLQFRIVFRPFAVMSDFFVGLCNNNSNIKSKDLHTSYQQTYFQFKKMIGYYFQNKIDNLTN